jgi:pyruvate-formate lyase-activating enzyme
MRIHLAGGEPFRDWDHLVAVIAAARAAGLTPLEKVETNAFWATDDELTRARPAPRDPRGQPKLVVGTHL